MPIIDLETAADADCSAELLCEAAKEAAAGGAAGEIIAEAAGEKVTFGCASLKIKTNTGVTEQKCSLTTLYAGSPVAGWAGCGLLRRGGARFEGTAVRWTQQYLSQQSQTYFPAHLRKG